MSEDRVATMLFELLDEGGNVLESGTGSIVPMLDGSEMLLFAKTVIKVKRCVAAAAVRASVGRHERTFEIKPTKLQEGQAFYSQVRIFVGDWNIEDCDETVKV